MTLVQLMWKNLSAGDKLLWWNIVWSKSLVFCWGEMSCCATVQSIMDIILLEAMSDSVDVQASCETSVGRNHKFIAL